MSSISARRQQRAHAYVERHVLLCQTALVTHLFESSVFDWSDIQNLYNTGPDAVDLYLSERVQLDDWHELQSDEREALAREHGFEPEPQEIYEWWAVSFSMECALLDLGEPILSNCYGTWWGRTCSGQAIYLDGVIDRLVERAEKAP